MLPAGVAQVGDLDLEALLQLRALIEDQLGTEGREELTQGLLLPRFAHLGSWFCFGFGLFLFGFWLFGGDLACLFLVFFEFSLEVLALVLVEVFALEFFLDF